MIERLHHRGPDGYGFYEDGQTGLAHGRLIIIDLEGGSQPIHNEVELPRIRGRFGAWVTSGYPQAARGAPQPLPSAQPCG